ncbi:hypothetical protein LPJ66_001279 [Kickxella alabastrina]|uniref:Uncharacterized protein n=1 Tax=Kickxella alabastrina TaxID=61397 RepID=A0ACC1ITN7_9FUNG|nr:hypothetical protein LPJ66_001279 [Kickxella alabastrina]
MKLQLSTSALLVWLAAYIHAAETIENNSAIHKRGLTIGDQPVIGEDTVAHTIGDSTSADDLSAIAAAAAVAAAVNPRLGSNQIIQSPAMMLDNTLSNLRGSPLGYLQLQQALNSPHFMLNPGVGIPPGMQHFANLPQIVLQAPPAAPVAPVTIVQTVSVTATASVSTLTSQTAAVPVTITVFSAATVATTQSAVPDIVTVTALAPVVVTVFESAATPVAAVAPAAVPAPVAVVAPVAGPAAIPAAAPAAQLAYPDVALNQAVAAAAVAAATAPTAAVAGPVAAVVLAQQQVAQPLLAQVPTAALASAPAVAGAILTASILGSNQNAQPVLLPIDSQLAELLSRSGLTSALLSDSGAAPLGTVDDNTANDSQDGSAAIDEDEVYVAPRQSPKTIARHTAPHANNRKSKLIVDADAELDAASADVAEEEAPPAKPVASVSAPRKNKAITKTAGSGTAKKAAALNSALAAASAAEADTDESAATDLNISDVPNMRFRASSGSTEETLDFEAEANSVSAAAVDAENEYESSCARTLGIRGRGTVTNLKDEAFKARAEASAEAREAVLSEIRAEASAQAALQASSELRLSGKTVVCDAAAYSECATNSYDVDCEYHKEKTQTSYDEETQRSWGLETEANYILKTERYQKTRSKSADSDTWNYHRQSDSWENKCSLNYDDIQSPPYHPYETSSYDQSQANYGDYNERPQTKYADSYGHMQSNYGDEPATNDNWKLHYDGASPTMYPASDVSSYINYNSDPRPYTNTYYTNSYGDHQGESHAGYNGYDTQVKPFNFVNMRFDAALARDAAGVSVDAPCVMIIGVPQPTMQTVPVNVPVNMPAPQAATVTKLVTQAVKFVLASNSNSKDDEDSD